MHRFPRSKVLCALLRGGDIGLGLHRVEQSGATQQALLAAEKDLEAEDVYGDVSLA
jgi:hypothetical protein